MPCHVISGAHELINEIRTVPSYHPAKPQLWERAKLKLRDLRNYFWFFAQSRMLRWFILGRACLKLKICSRAGRAITLGRAGSDGVLSRAGRGGFFFQSRRSSIAKFRPRWSGIAKFESRRSFLKSRTSTRVKKAILRNFSNA